MENYCMPAIFPQPSRVPVFRGVNTAVRDTQSADHIGMGTGREGIRAATAGD